MKILLNLIFRFHQIRCIAFLYLSFLNPTENARCTLWQLVAFEHKYLLDGTQNFQSCKRRRHYIWFKIEKWLQSLAKNVWNNTDVKMVSNIKCMYQVILSHFYMTEYTLIGYHKCITTHVFFLQHWLWCKFWDTQMSICQMQCKGFTNLFS